MMDDYNVFFLTMKGLRVDLSVFMQPVDGFYRPLATLVLKLSYSLFGLNSVGYHLANLSLYFLICMIFLFIVRKLFILSASDPSDPDIISKANWFTFVCVILYCVHPINNMIVNYKTACHLAVFVICMQISFWAFLSYMESKQVHFYRLSVFFYLCSLFCNEIGSILPAYLFLVAYYLRSKSFKTSLFMLWPYLLCFTFYIILWSHILIRQISGGCGLDLPFTVYMATLYELIRWYVSKLIFPKGLLFLWDVPVSGHFLFARLGGLFMFLSIIVFLYFIFIKSKKKLEIFSLTFFLIGFMPFGFAAFVYTKLTHSGFIEPHWFYFSSLGFFMLITSVLFALVKNRGHFFKIACLVGMIILLVILTRQSDLPWKNNETYCQYWIKMNPFNAAPYEYLAEDQKLLASTRGFLRSNNTKDIRKDLILLIMNDRDPAFLTKLGVAIANSGQYSMAFDALDRAITIDPRYGEAYFNLGVLMANTGKYNEAIRVWQKGEEVDPKDHRFEINILKAMALVNRGNNPN